MKQEEIKQRLIIGIILIIALATLCTYYATHYEEHLKYPSYRAILSDYPLQEVVNVGGTVTKVDADGFLIKENYHGQIITMKILTDNSESNINQSRYNSTSINTPVSVNDRVSVVGVLGPHNQIVSVQKMEITEYWNYIFILLRSFLALLVLAYIFNRYWHFDRESFEFRRR
ncbi:hypothetical protein [Methanobacterium petrolearium]|uniref:hypothetical protein n=1 Tax=Methanobacterium petrolearium TaxID=710190 RepID=UPI001AE52F14|nr:hypothetical protein [Methanobacterium petrolearium]MBP1945435.1 hypothetical protein [Methanobacterium petrolearium]BDZ71633.1 hypothetical protein GCM10025861_21500 [Methanobacterium petrolearium]